IILPVPTERTKGVVLCPTIFGNALIGPTAEEQEDRRRASVDQATLISLVATAERMVPGLAHMPVTAVYAGLRPASDKGEYRLFADRDRNLVTVGGIRSTGLTAALGIAQYVMRAPAACARSGSVRKAGPRCAVSARAWCPAARSAHAQSRRASAARLASGRSR